MKVIDALEYIKNSGDDKDIEEVIAFMIAFGLINKQRLLECIATYDVNKLIVR